MDIVGLIIIGVISRLVPHLPNMTAVGALALFSGYRYGFKKAIVVTFITMLISDLIKGFHPVMWATYGSFLLAIVLGRLIAGQRRPGLIAGAILSSSTIFFLVTNFAVWLVPGSMYPKTVTGLVDCYIMALPFFRNSLLGDMFYGLVFFGGYELVLAMKPKPAY